ncbi:histone-lysine N-methyltransferase SETMAR [Trichonephila clavipes]|nr:histone-lysine N-methyltransferase SETMAR [Trichonephila clavipes]
MYGFPMSSQRESLLKRHENDPFLKRIITGDEKWVVYKKLLPDNTTITSEVYCHQLDKLNDALQQKRSDLINRKGVVFHQDNARPHTSLVTRQKLLQLEWDTMPHPPYSPDLAPSDYYLFRSLQNFLDGKSALNLNSISKSSITDLRSPISAIRSLLSDLRYPISPLTKNDPFKLQGRDHYTPLVTSH